MEQPQNRSIYFEQLCNRLNPYHLAIEEKTKAVILLYAKQLSPIRAVAVRVTAEYLNEHCEHINTKLKTIKPEQEVKLWKDHKAQKIEGVIEPKISTLKKVLANHDTEYSIANIDYIKASLESQIKTQNKVEIERKKSKTLLIEN